MHKYLGLPLDKPMASVALRKKSEAPAPSRIGTEISADVLGELCGGLSVSSVGALPGTDGVGPRIKRRCAFGFVI
ncbi:MAG: hypothetical protein WBO24_01110 [Nitrospirales bacterium]